MHRETRLSVQTIRVLKPFLANPAAEITGAQIMKVSGLPSGTAYPIMLRLERHGYLTSRWEEGDPRTLARPRRRFYSITNAGAAAARQALNELATVTSHVPIPEVA